MSVVEELGRRIRELRKKKGLSQEQVAEQAGISGKYLGEVERGEVNVSVLVLSKLATVFQVDMSEMLRWRHQRNRKELQDELIDWLEKASNEDVRRIYRVIAALLK